MLNKIEHLTLKKKTKRDFATDQLWSLDDHRDVLEGQWWNNGPDWIVPIDRAMILKIDLIEMDWFRFEGEVYSGRSMEERPCRLWWIEHCHADVSEEDSAECGEHWLGFHVDHSLENEREDQPITMRSNEGIKHSQMEFLVISQRSVQHLPQISTWYSYLFMIWSSSAIFRALINNLGSKSFQWLMIGKELFTSCRETDEKIDQLDRQMFIMVANLVIDDKCLMYTVYRYLTGISFVRKITTSDDRMISLCATLLSKSKVLRMIAVFDG